MPLQYCGNVPETVKAQGDLAGGKGIRAEIRNTNVPMKVKLNSKNTEIGSR